MIAMKADIFAPEIQYAPEPGEPGLSYDDALAICSTTHNLVRAVISTSRGNTKQATQMLRDWLNLTDY